MAKKDRSLQFIQVFKKDKQSGDESVASDLIDVLLHYHGFTGNTKKIKEINREKIGMVAGLHKYDSVSNPTETKLYYGHFLTAKHSFRPNLIHRKTGTQRKSPKEKDEGEVEKTHFGLVYDGDEALFILEINKNGLTYNQLLVLLSKYYADKSRTKPNFNLRANVVVVDNWKEVLQDAKGMKEIEIVADKKILGSAVMDITDNLISVKDKIRVIIPADNPAAFKSFAIDMVNKIGLLKFKTQNVKMRGTDSDDNQLLINQEFLEKRIPFRVEVDMETGEVDTNSFYNKVKDILEKY